MSEEPPSPTEDFFAHFPGRKVLSSAQDPKVLSSARDPRSAGDDVPTRVRAACARVAERARSVRIERPAIPAYAASLALPVASGLGAAPTAPADPTTPTTAPAPAAPSPEHLAAFWLTLDAINFGSGWFPTLRKRPGHSGYRTVEAGIRARFATHGPWSAEELAAIGPSEIARALCQDPDHELMALFAASLADLGRHVAGDHEGRFLAVVEAVGHSAPALATELAGWDCFADVSRYDGFEVPFYKRAQIAAADLAQAGVAGEAGLPGLPALHHLERLTMFADNLVPHVLRLDGILRFDPELVARVEREEPIEHGSREEVEIRACALHAVELIVAARSAGTAAAGAPTTAAAGAPTTAATIDRVLWERGGGPRYKARPRHRSRTTAY